MVLGGGGLGWGGGAQDGCERRSEVLMKIHKKKQKEKIEGWGGSGMGGGVRVNVNEELKFLSKFKKKKLGGGGWSGCVGSGGGRVWGQGGCE